MQKNTLGFPRVHLADLPTPFEGTPRFSRVLGGPQIFIKRDDATALALGGNKARKLEFLLGDALAKQCDTVITAGGPQSNHARMTAAASVKFGMQPVLVLDGDDPGTRQGNLLLDHILGARLVFTGQRLSEDVIEETAADLEREGKKPYVIPVGGSNCIGTLGYIGCAAELARDFADAGVSPSTVYVATGSSGTLAGLLLGKLIYQLSFSIKGVAVSPGAAKKEARVLELVMEAIGLIKQKLECLDAETETEVGSCDLREIKNRILNITKDDVKSNISITEDYVGPGYAVPTPEGIEAILTLARSEGIITDPVYTGKALACLIGDVRNGLYDKDEAIVFLHTGGAPANFAYVDAFLKEGI